MRRSGTSCDPTPTQEDGSTFSVNNRVAEAAICTGFVIAKSGGNWRQCEVRYKGGIQGPHLAGAMIASTAP